MISFLVNAIGLLLVIGLAWWFWLSNSAWVRANPSLDFKSKKRYK